LADGLAAERVSALALATFSQRLFGAAGAATEGGPTALLRVGAHAIRLRFASSAAAAGVLPAWGPLLADGSAEGTPLAELFVVTSDHCGPPPSPPWGAQAYRPRDEIDGFGDASMEVCFQLATGTLVLWDAATRRGVWWTRSADAIPMWERIMPLRALLRWALRSVDVALIHGAVVGSERGGLLLAGAGGVGKSTTALAAPRAGLFTLADDYAAVAPAGPVASPVTAFAKATERTIELLPELSSRLAPLAPTPEGKRAIVLDETPLRAASSMVLRGIVLPQIGQRTAAARAVPRAAAMAALAPTTLFQLPGSRPADQRMLAEITRALPAFSLAVGPAPDAVAAALSDLLGALA
jgi:hypothetical protein